MSVAIGDDYAVRLLSPFGLRSWYNCFVTQVYPELSDTVQAHCTVLCRPLVSGGAGGAGNL